MCHSRGDEKNMIVALSDAVYLLFSSKFYTEQKSRSR